MQATLFLLMFAWMFGAYGLALFLNLFGAGAAEARFYSGRGFWYPILDGSKRGTHRLAGGLMVLFAGLSTLAFWSAGQL